MGELGLPRGGGCHPREIYGNSIPTKMFIWSAKLTLGERSDTGGGSTPEAAYCSVNSPRCNVSV